MLHGEARLPLERDPTAASDARQSVRRFCADMPRDLQTTAQLLTSELVTNALQHGDGAIELQLRADPTALRVEVSDESPERPQRMNASAGSVSGRGMLLVEALASSWGILSHPGDGKAVWFELRRR